MDVRRDINKDVVAPGSPQISAPDVTGANVRAVPVTGSGEPGSTVTVTATDRAGASVPVEVAAAPDGTFTAELDLSALADGQVTLTAVAVDAAGNPSAAASTMVGKDTAAPVPTVSAQPVNVASGGQLTVSGTVETGAGVRVTVTDTSGASVSDTTTGIDGAYSVTLAVGALSDGPLRIVVVATDRAGNSAERRAQVTKDVTAPQTPTVRLPERVDAANVRAVPVSGTAERGATVLVTVTDESGATRTASVVAGADGYATTVDVSGLADGPLTVLATVTDALGNASAAARGRSSRPAPPPPRPPACGRPTRATAGSRSPGRRRHRPAAGR